MKICTNCGAQTKNPKFCSRSCSIAYNNRICPKTQLQGKCKHCQKKISSTKTYCKDCWQIKPWKTPKSPPREKNLRIRKKKCKTCDTQIPINRVYCGQCIKSTPWAPKQKLTKDERANVKEIYCPRCKTIKSSNNFSFNRQKSKWSGYCRKCYSEDVKQRFRQYKQRCVEYKGGKCERCGYNKCIGAMDFHHKDPLQKDFNLAGLRYSSWEKSKDKVIPELDKCELLCSNCHREVHYE